MTARLEDGPTTVEATRARCRARWWVVLAAALAGVLVTASGAAALARDNRRLAEVDAIGAAAGRATDAVGDLATVVPAARAALAESAGRVGDAGVRTALARALDAALTAARARGATVDEIDAATAQVASSRDMLVAATSATTAEVASWELARATTERSRALARLGEALSAARGVLDASAGWVADDAVRQSLARAVDQAELLAEADAPGEALALSASAVALEGATDALAAPQAAVTEAVASWTQAQAATARPVAVSPGAVGSRASGAKTAGATGASQAEAPGAGSSANPYGGLTWVPDADGSHTWCTDATGNTWWCDATPVPAGAPDGSQWQETVANDDSFTVCMDTEGNWWWCNP